jgi:dTDP-4-dehydrorhamnose reductase
MSGDSSEKKRTVLVTGASGFGGSKVLSRLKDSGYNVIGTAHRNKPPESDVPFPLADLADARAAFDMINKYQPDAVVHTAGNTHLDLCEIYQEQAWMSNVIAVKNLVGLAMLFGYRLLFFSSEQAYGEHPDGEGAFFLEDDPLSPLNFYGKTKMAAEEVIREHLDNYIIFRPSLIYGWGNKSHISWCDHLYEDIEEGIQVKLYSDQVRSMIYVEDIAEAVLKFMEKPDITGVFNLGGDTPYRRSDFAAEFARNWSFDEKLIAPVTMEKYPPETRRPKNCALDIKKIKNVVGFNPTGLSDSLKIMKEKNPHPPLKNAEKKPDSGEK